MPPWRPRRARPARTAPEAAGRPAPRRGASVGVQQRGRHRAHAAHGLRARRAVPRDRRSRPVPRLRLRQSARADLRAHPRPRSGAIRRDGAVRRTACRSRSRCASDCTRAVLSAGLRRVRRPARPGARPLRRRGRRPDRHRRHGAPQGRDRRCAREGDRAARGACWKNDCGARELEGLPSYVETALGEAPGVTSGRGERRALPRADRRAARRPAGSTTRPRTGARSLKYVHGARVLDVFSYLGRLGSGRRAGRRRRGASASIPRHRALEQLQRSRGRERPRARDASRRRVRRARGAARGRRALRRRDPRSAGVHQAPQATSRRGRRPTAS